MQMLPILIAGLFLGMPSKQEAIAVDIAPSISRAKEPQGAFLADGRLAVTFASPEGLWFAVQSAGKSGFEAPVLIKKESKLMAGMRRGPRIATAAKDLVITATLPNPLRGEDLCAFRSADQGKSWQGPFRVNDVPGCTPEGLHGMAGLSRGRVACVWLDNRNKTTELVYSESADSGRTWSKNVTLYVSPDGTICECCHPSISASGDGALVMFRNWLGGNRDMYALEVPASPKGALKASKLGVGSWPLKACPMDGGAIARVGGERVSIWRREGTVYLAGSGTSEVTLGPGFQPWIASHDGRAWAVWIERRNGPLYLQEISAQGHPMNNRRQLANTADDPVAVLSDKGVLAVLWNEATGPKATFLDRADRSTNRALHP